ncbi:hypothetical protein JCM3766R1_003132 [Sporobolomyces carnicolor]
MPRPWSKKDKRAKDERSMLSPVPDSRVLDRLVSKERQIHTFPTDPDGYDAARLALRADVRDREYERWTHEFAHFVPERALAFVRTAIHEHDLNPPPRERHRAPPIDHESLYFSLIEPIILEYVGEADVARSSSSTSHLVDERRQQVITDRMKRVRGALGQFDPLDPDNKRLPQIEPVGDISLATRSIPRRPVPVAVNLGGLDGGHSSRTFSSPPR